MTPRYHTSANVKSSYSPLHKAPSFTTRVPFVSHKITSTTEKDTTCPPVLLEARLIPHINRNEKRTEKRTQTLRGTQPLHADDPNECDDPTVQVPPNTILYGTAVPVFGKQTFNKTVYQVKVIKSGSTMLDVVRFQYPHVHKHYKESRLARYGVRARQTAQRRYDNVRRARARMTQLVHANWPKMAAKYTAPCFVTLTFKRDGEIDIAHKSQHQHQMRLIKAYHERMAVMFPDLRFIWVKELHKDGEHVHFHVLYFNLGYNTYEQMNKAWPHGYVTVDRVKGGLKDIGKCAGYLAKYMGKTDPHDTNTKLYVPSQNLLKPEEHYHPMDVHAILKEWAHVPYKQTIRHNPYTNEFVVHRKYLLGAPPDTEKAPITEPSVQVAL